MRELLQYLECGCAVSTHGIAGNIRLENRCNSPEDLARLRKLYVLKGGVFVPIKVQKASVQKSMVLVKLEGIDSVDAAAAMRGTVFYAARDDIKRTKGEVFIADILGLPVIDLESGKVYGELFDVIRPGAQQIYVVKCEGGKFMIPCVPEFIKEISMGAEGERPEGIYVTLIEGMDEPI